MSDEQLTLITKYTKEANSVLNQLFLEPDTESKQTDVGTQPVTIRVS